MFFLNTGFSITSLPSLLNFRIFLLPPHAPHLLALPYIRIPASLRISGYTHAMLGAVRALSILPPRAHRVLRYAPDSPSASFFRIFLLPPHAPHPLPHTAMVRKPHHPDYVPCRRGQRSVDFFRCCPRGPLPPPGASTSEYDRRRKNSIQEKHEVALF